MDDPSGGVLYDFDLGGAFGLIRVNYAGRSSYNATQRSDVVYYVSLPQFFEARIHVLSDEQLVDTKVFTPLIDVPSHDQDEPK